MRQIFSALLLLILILPLNGQDYRDQISLIRPRPENCMIFGPISLDKNIPVTDATISLIDLATHKVVEKINSDRNSWYLFSTIKKGQKFALLIEKEGLFPYYHEFLIPIDFEPLQLEKPIVLPADLQCVYSLYYTPLDTTPGPLSRVQIEKLARLLKSNRDLIAVFEPLGDTLDAIRINLLTSNFMNRGVKRSQFSSGTLAEAPSGVIRIEILTGTVEPDIMNTGDLPLTDDSWTIQFSASRSKLSKKSYKGLDPVHEFKGKDGFFRYTFGTFASKEEAVQKIQMVKKKGFSQAFAKTVESIKKL